MTKSNQKEQHLQPRKALSVRKSFQNTQKTLAEHLQILMLSNSVAAHDRAIYKYKAEIKRTDSI